MNYLYYKVKLNDTLLKKLNRVRTSYESFINEYISNYDNMVTVNNKPVKPIYPYDYIKYLVSDDNIQVKSAIYRNKCSVKSINPYNLYLDLNEIYNSLNALYCKYDESYLSLTKFKSELRKINRFNKYNPLNRLYVGVKDISIIDQNTIFIKKIGVIRLEKELPKAFKNPMRNCISYAIIIFDRNNDKDIQILFKIKSNILLGANPLVIGYSPNGIGLMGVCSTPLIGFNTRVTIRDPLAKVRYRTAYNDYTILSSVFDNMDEKGIINIDNIDTVHLEIPFVNFIKALNRSEMELNLKIRTLKSLINELEAYKNEIADEISADKIDTMLSRVKPVYDSIYIISPAKEIIDAVTSDDNKHKLRQFNARHIANKLKQIPEFNKIPIETISVYDTKAYADAINAEMPDQRELLNEFLKTTLE